MKKIEDITEVELIFENCDVIKIPKNYISSFSINGIKESICFDNFSTYKTETAESCYIEIDRKYTETNTFKYGKDYISILERINEKNSICRVVINFEDKTERDISVPWGENDEYINEYQKVEIKDDEIIIEIKE